MKKLLKQHLQKLCAEQERLEQYLASHLDESKTMLYAEVNLGLEWCKLKIMFWSAVLNQQSD